MEDSDFCQGGTLLTVDIAVPDVVELQRLAERGHENGYLTDSEIKAEIAEAAVEVSEDSLRDFLTYCVEHDIEIIAADDSRSDGAFGAVETKQPAPAVELDLT